MGLEAVKNKTMSNPFVISAECYDNFKQHLIKFNAVDWFEQSSNDAIMTLVRRDWISSNPTDGIVDSFAEIDLEISTRINTMFDYIEAPNRPDRGDPFSYVFKIDADDALAWIEENRLELHSEILQYFVGQLILNAQLHNAELQKISHQLEIRFF